MLRDRVSVSMDLIVRQCLPMFAHVCLFLPV